MMGAALRTLLVCALFLALHFGWAAYSRIEVAGDICEGHVVVEVLNGCGIAGIGDRVGQRLLDHGFDVLFVANADDFNYDRTLVINRTGDTSKAVGVADAIGCGCVVRQRTESFFVDVTVIVGKDAGALPDWRGL